MILEFVGKFYDNHSLTIINRNVATRLAKKFDVYITSLDSYDPQFNIDHNLLSEIKKLEQKDLGDQVADIQVRHSYPPVWHWPQNKKTKVVLFNLGNILKFLLNGNISLKLLQML